MAGGLAPAFHCPGYKKAMASVNRHSERLLHPELTGPNLCQRR
jgi:hypothetical protein